MSEPRLKKHTSSVRWHFTDLYTWICFSPFFTYDTSIQRYFIYYTIIQVYFIYYTIIRYNIRLHQTSAGLWLDIPEKLTNKTLSRHLNLTNMYIKNNELLSKVSLHVRKDNGWLTSVQWPVERLFVHSIQHPVNGGNRTTCEAISNGFLTLQLWRHANRDLLQSCWNNCIPNVTGWKPRFATETRSL